VFRVSVYLGDDLFGWLGPDEGVLALVLAGDELPDSDHEIANGGERSASDGLAFDDAEPDVDHVQPGAGRGVKWTWIRGFSASRWPERSPQPEKASLLRQQPRRSNQPQPSPSHGLRCLRARRESPIPCRGPPDQCRSGSPIASEPAHPQVVRAAAGHAMSGEHTRSPAPRTSKSAARV